MQSSKATSVRQVLGGVVRSSGPAGGCSQHLYGVSEFGGAEVGIPAGHLCGPVAQNLHHLAFRNPGPCEGGGC